MNSITMRFNPRAITERFWWAWRSVSFAVGDFCGLGLRHSILPLGQIKLAPGEIGRLSSSPCYDVRPGRLVLNSTQHEPGALAKIVVDDLRIGCQSQVNGTGLPATMFGAAVVDNSYEWPILRCGQSFTVSVRNQGTEPIDLTGCVICHS